MTYRLYRSNNDELKNNVYDDNDKVDVVDELKNNVYCELYNV